MKILQSVFASTLHPLLKYIKYIQNVDRILSKTAVKLEAWLPKECVMETTWGILKTAGQGKLG